MKFLALGGNLGPVLDTFAWALQRLEAEGVAIAAVSAAYRTEAVRWPGVQQTSPPYWNAVCQVRTALPCEAVLALCKRLEADAGRVTVGAVRWGARPLDLDLLLWDDDVRETPVLTLPHPRLHERLFVLRPLCDLAASLQVPGHGRSVGALLAQFHDTWSGILLRRVFWTTAPAGKKLSQSGVRVAAQVIAAQGN